jgi:hypothetical protein
MKYNTFFTYLAVIITVTCVAWYIQVSFITPIETGAIRLVKFCLGLELGVFSALLYSYSRDLKN